MRVFRTLRGSKTFTHSCPVRSHPTASLQRTPPFNEPEEGPKKLPPAQLSHSYVPGKSCQQGNLDRLFDEAYIRALRDRDQEIETHLVNSLSRPLSVKLHSRLRSPQLIEDARQETFLRVFVYFRSGKILENPASLPSFVLSVCNNVCHEFLRSHTRQEQMPVTDLGPLDKEANPEQRVVTEERKRLVTSILNNLSTKDRLVLKRVFLDEADKDQVCHELGIDREYLRLLVHRAKLRFRRALQGELTYANI